MRLVHNTTNFDFLGKRKLCAILSGSLLLISVVCLVIRGLAFGIDFTGGTLIEIGFEHPADLHEVRTVLTANNYRDATVQHFGTTRDVLIRIAPRPGLSSADLSNRVLSALHQHIKGKLSLRRVEFVGPQVGSQLAEDGALAAIAALALIMVYVALRFEYRFSVGAVLALVHDVTITLGVFSLLQLEFNLTVLAAVLAVIGYSLNDTIVIFDRIRENFRKMRKGTAMEVVNVSVNQTLSRTLITSLTVILVLIALFFLGGEVIHNFSIALLIGVVVGTYSSIYVASPIALVMGISKSDLMKPQKQQSSGAQL